jgi:hypothetical protein
MKNSIESVKKFGRARLLPSLSGYEACGSKTQREPRPSVVGSTYLKSNYDDPLKALPS